MQTFSFSRSPLVLALVLAALGCGSAQANDSSFGDDNGTIRLLHQPDISMDKEALLLSEERVQVDYVFTNNSERALTVPIAFPMPPMYFGMADHSELTDFKLWVDGKPIATTRKLVVLLDDGSDISKAFAASGWSAHDVATFTESGAVPKDASHCLRAGSTPTSSHASRSASISSGSNCFPRGAACRSGMRTRPACPPACRRAARSCWSRMRKTPVLSPRPEPACNAAKVSTAWAGPTCAMC